MGLDRKTPEELEQWVRAKDAPPSQVWVCGACGKQASNPVDHPISRGWDESCFLHAVLCHQEKVDGKWRAIRELSPM